MSGPKVVRIVTREEIIATCQAHLARLDAAARAYAEFCQKRGLASGDELAALEKRRIALHALLAAGRFLDLQKRVRRKSLILRPTDRHGPKRRPSLPPSAKRAFSEQGRSLVRFCLR